MEMNLGLTISMYSRLQQGGVNDKTMNSILFHCRAANSIKFKPV